MNGDSRGNWSKVPHALIFDPTLSAQALRLGAILLAFDGLGHGCFPSEETLCHHFGSRAKMYRALAELRDRGYVSVTKIGRRNRYDLKFPYTPVVLKAPTSEARRVSKVRPDREDPILELRVRDVSNVRPEEEAESVSDLRRMEPNRVANMRPAHVSDSRPTSVESRSQKRDVERDTRILRNNSIKKFDGDGIDPLAIRALAIETRVAECGISDKEAGGIAKALTPTDIPIGLIVEAAWDVMRRPARLRADVSNLVGYILATVHRKAAKTPLELYRDKLEACDPTGEIYLRAIDDTKRARILAYMQKAGLRQLSGPRLRDLQNYLDYTDRMLGNAPMSA